MQRAGKTVSVVARVKSSAEGNSPQLQDMQAVLENVRKTAAMHNSVKKILLKTRTDEGVRPSARK